MTKHEKFLAENRHRYDELLAAQGGHCALCPREPTARRRLDMDHDHKRMVLRGLLCWVCNRAVPDNMPREWVEKLPEYMARTV